MDRCYLPRFSILIVALAFFTRVATAQQSSASSQTTGITEEQLKVFNRDVTTTRIDTCADNKGEPFKLLIIGNSHSFHGKAEKIGWFQDNGMAASSREKDFAHLLFGRIQTTFPELQVCLSVANLAEFERGFHTYSFSRLNSLAQSQPDLIVFQLGHNVKFSDEMPRSLFVTRYSELISLFKKESDPIIVCTNLFPSSPEKNEAIYQVALTTNSFLVDLSHMDLDKQNYAAFETNYPGDKTTWKVDGIGRHPGDYGMENIARQIFVTVNAALKNRIKKP